MINAGDRFYLDTSAYLTILTGGKAASILTKLLSRGVVCSSILLLLETERNLIRLSRDKKLNSNQYILCMERLKADVELFLLKEVTFDLCLNSVFPAVLTPKTSDLIHLRTALWFKENGGLTCFVTLDEQQKKAAVDFGLQVY